MFRKKEGNMKFHSKQKKIILYYRIEAVIFDRHILVSGSQDKTVKIWDIKSGKYTHTFEGHQGGVWCLSFFTPNLILSGSHDGSIKVS